MDWIEQQTREKEEIRDNKAEEKRQFDQLTQAVNDMRNNLQNEKAKRLKDMEIACKNTNKQQLEDKKGRERNDREAETQDTLDHIAYITNTDFFTENTVEGE